MFPGMNFNNKNNAALKLMPSDLLISSPGRHVWQLRHLFLLAFDLLQPFSCLQLGQMLQYPPRSHPGPVQQM
jgi:hypothetical protein